jgi:hypothetical protein
LSPNSQVPNCCSAHCETSKINADMTVEMIV